MIITVSSQKSGDVVLKILHRTIFNTTSPCFLKKSYNPVLSSIHSLLWEEAGVGTELAPSANLSPLIPFPRAIPESFSHLTLIYDWQCGCRMG